MDKRAFTSFTDSYLKRAGQEYMSMQQIDNLKRQEKLAKENLTYQKRKHKESTELDIAKLIVAARQEKTGAGAPLTGAAKLADVQADRLAKGEPTYITEKRGEFAFGYEGVGGKDGGAKAGASLRVDLRGIEDDSRAIINSIQGIAIGDEGKQIVSNASGKMEEVIVRGGTEQDLTDIYNNTLDELRKTAEKTPEKRIFIDTAINDLGRYINLKYRQIKILRNLGELGRSPGASTQTQPVTQPVTKPAVEKPKPSVITEEVKRQVKDAWFDKSKAIAWKYEKLAEIAEKNGITDVQVLIDIVVGK